MEADHDRPVHEQIPQKEADEKRVIQADDQSDTEPFDVANIARIGSARLGDISDPWADAKRPVAPPKDVIRSEEVLNDPENLNNQ